MTCVLDCLCSIPELGNKCRSTGPWWQCWSCARGAQSQREQCSSWQGVSPEAGQSEIKKYSLLKYSNYLNTEHLKFEHLTIWTLFCPVFKCIRISNDQISGPNCISSMIPLFDLSELLIFFHIKTTLKSMKALINKL